MKELGKISFPEQYAPVGNEVRVKDSVEALAFFEDFYPIGGTVLLGNLRLQTKKLSIIDLLIWLYVDCSDANSEIISSIPVFDVQAEEFDDCQILEVTPHQDEVFSLWSGTLYSSVYTSTGEVCIKKVRALLNTDEAAQVIEMQSGQKVEDIYPIELYSYSEHKFVGVCWAVVMEDDCNRIFWHPVCLEEEKAISAYSVEDLTDYFINVGETAVIGGDTFRLRFKEENFFFEKVQSKEELLGKLSAQLKIRAQQTLARAGQPKIENDERKGKFIMLPFPKRLQTKN